MAEKKEPEQGEHNDDIDKVLKGEARADDPDVDTRLHPPDEADKKTGEK